MDVETSSSSSALSQDLLILEKDIAQKLQEGDVFHAYNLALKALEVDPQHIKIREYAALALLRTGAMEDAKNILGPVLEGDYEEDSDIIHLMATIYKECWASGQTPEDLEKSHRLYLEHFQKSKDLASGVQAMWTAWLLHNDSLAYALADEIIDLTQEKKKQKDVAEDKSIHLEGMIALAQCYLLKGDHDLSIAMLNRVQTLASKDSPASIVGLLATLKFMNEQGFLIEKSFFDTLTPPTIVVFTGQRMDLPGQEIPSFTPEIEQAVSKKIEDMLDQIDASIGYSSAVCGADILFIEAMLKRKKEIHIVLPYDKDDFIEHNVSYAGPRWEARFKEALARATSVRFATEEKFLGHDMLHRFGNLMLHGLAEMRGNFLLSPPHLVAVWDASPHSLVGGASDFIDHWPDIRTLHLIDLDDIKTTYRAEHPLNVLPPHLKTIRPKHTPFFEDFSKTPRIIKCMLFSDLAGFSKMKEENMPGFLDFLESLRKTMGKVAPKVEALNTWGDAIFAVTSSASDLAEYALRLSEMVPDISRNTRSMPELNVRVSLHAGPVYQSMDPFREVINFYGGHINRAARLEPVTVIGQVYATEQFMALLTAEQSALRVEKGQKNLPYIQSFTCEYVGVVSLAKSFGVQPVYHLRRL